jgi:hypothetical protein
MGESILRCIARKCQFDLSAVKLEDLPPDFVACRVRRGRQINQRTNNSYSAHAGPIFFRSEICEKISISVVLQSARIAMKLWLKEEKAIER